jgi:Protein phosphatase 2C
VEVFGATLRGPAHAADGLPNQDAWAHGRAGTLRVIVASDGMGSRPFARDGARAACSAVVEAVRQWRRYPDAPVDILLGLIHLLWRARIAPRAPEDCACTCLFAAMAPDGSGVAGQLGDGLVLVRDSAGLQLLASRGSGQFVNETAALGITNRIAAWTSLALQRGPRSVVLCTDGVADDLLPKRLGDFTDWLVHELCPLSPHERWRRLMSALRDWPTPRHLDDKTIVVAHVPASTR